MKKPRRHYTPKEKVAILRPPGRERKRQASLARPSQCAPMAQITGGGRTHSVSCR